MELNHKAMNEAKGLGYWAPCIPQNRLVSFASLENSKCSPCGMGNWVQAWAS